MFAIVLVCVAGPSVGKAALYLDYLLSFIHSI